MVIAAVREPVTVCGQGQFQGVVGLRVISGGIVVLVDGVSAVRREGVATGLGTLFIISPLAGAIALLGVAVAALTRYVSVGSIMGSGMSLGLLAVLSLFEVSVLGTQHDRWYLLFAIPVAVLILWRHQPNIDRLAKGDESRLENKPNPRRAHRTP